MDTTKDRVGLLGLAVLIVIGLVLIGIIALVKKLTPEAATLVGVIVTGLVAWGKDIIAAIRGYSMSAQLSKVTDQLAASGPVANDNTVVPKDAVEGARQAADAATTTADNLAEKQA